MCTYTKYRRLSTGTQWRDATLSKFSTATHLGSYKTVCEAFVAYKVAKEQHIRDVANLYKDKIDERVYNALMTYEVEVDD